MIDMLQEIAQKVPGPLAAIVGFFLWRHVQRDEQERKLLREELATKEYIGIMREDTNQRLDRIESKLDQNNRTF
jgi:HAMP domain-containing protein